MNYIEQFLKDNNLEIGQKFRPKRSNTDIWFDENFEIQGTSAGCKVIFLTEIMTGKFEFEEELPKRWRAEKGHPYYFINTGGRIFVFYEYFRELDDFRYAIGNYFETEEQAEEYKKKLLVKQRCADMSDITQEQKLDKQVIKHTAKYDVLWGVIYAGKCCTIVDGGVCFSTEEKCLQAIKEIGEEDIKKYVLEV